MSAKLEVPGSRLRLDIRSMGGWFELVARASDARQPGTALRVDAAQTAQQNGVTDEVFTAGGLAVIVEGIAGELLRSGRVEGDIEQVRAVAVATEHIRSDKAGTSVVAFVPENAIEF